MIMSSQLLPCHSTSLKLPRRRYLRGAFRPLLSACGRSRSKEEHSSMYESKENHFRPQMGYRIHSLVDHSMNAAEKTIFTRCLRAFMASLHGFQPGLHFRMEVPSVDHFRWCHFRISPAIKSSTSRSPRVSTSFPTTPETLQSWSGFSRGYNSTQRKPAGTRDSPFIMGRCSIFLLHSCPRSCRCQRT